MWIAPSSKGRQLGDDGGPPGLGGSCSGDPAPMSRVSGEQGAAPPAARRRRPWAGHVLRWAVGIGAAVAAFDVVFGRRDELTGALSILEHLRWPWVVVALAAELGSIAAYAGLHRRLLRPGGPAVGAGA